MKGPCVNIQLVFPDSKPPQRATDGAAAFDVFADETRRLVPGETYKMSLGFKMEGPEKHGAFLLPRSGKGSSGLWLANVVGLIDWDYRGIAMANLFLNPLLCQEPVTIKRGDAIAQMAIIPVWIPKLQIVSALSDTVRGEGGFGSTGQ